ncbi:hypothetical protein ALP00_200049 [Pseudomonas coronafaciens pv. porri]|nr:hypothetical protein ALP00_200049 [Pseudomonas coronafaciens pv. porri]
MKTPGLISEASLLQANNGVDMPTPFGVRHAGQLGAQPIIEDDVFAHGLAFAIGGAQQLLHDDVLQNAQ